MRARILLGIVLLCAGNGLATQPNILLIMADDMNWRDCSPYYGRPGGHAPGDMPGDLTPNIQTLAGQGLRFDRCYNASPTCAPLRQQLYTGIYPVRNGAYPNHSEVKEGTKSIVHHLSALGYRVGLMGKRHFGPVESFPFELLGDDVDDSTENPANRALAEAFMARDPNQPYCLIVTSHSPHTPWNHGDYVADNSTLPVTPDYVDTSAYRAQFNKYLKEVNVFDSEVGYWMNAVANSSDPDNTIFICLTEQGSSLPGGKWTCYTLGAHTGCIIRWPGRVAPGTSTEAVVELVDILPTLIDAAGGSPPTGLERFDGLSFLPVLEGKRDYHKQYAYAEQTTVGIEGAVGPFAIRSVCDSRYELIWNLQNTNTYGIGGFTGPPFPSWEALAADTNADPSDRAHAQLIVDRIMNRPPYQFYDMQADPYELNNLIDDPQYIGKIADMKQRLQDWMGWQRDKGVATELAADITAVPVADEAHPYDAWANRFPFVWMADRTPAADPDDDGDNNLTEWLKNSDPLAATLEPGIKILSTTSYSDGPNAVTDLVFDRSVYHAGWNQFFTVEACSALSSNSWTTVPGMVAGYPAFTFDPLMEQVVMRVTETNATPHRFYRIGINSLADYTGAPTNYFSGTANPTATLGATQPILNDRDITLTVRAQLPAQPLAADKAQMLWKFGGSDGISLALMGDMLVFSGCTSTSLDGALNLSAVLDPSDFGKTITIRQTLDHKTSSTDFQLSYIVDGGSSGSTDVAIQFFTGYIGTATRSVGETGGRIPGISGAPYGLLATLPNGTSDISAWSAGPIQYEIIGTVADSL
ncbi:MAG: sulfatase [Kiritimatiellales bacterium]|nr:sulfatase [Kiritimatiellales bacterium]